MKDELKYLELDDIIIDDDWNCRLQILPINIAELVDSIEEHGLQQPVVVTPPDKNGKHKLIMGYRRCHAYKRLIKEGRIEDTKIKALVNHEAAVDEKTARSLNLTENLHRQNLNMLEEAKALAWYRDAGYNRAETAHAVKMGEGWVQVRLMLLDLPEEVQYEAALGWLKEYAIRQLYTIYKKQGKLAVYEAVKKAKEARERGEKIRLVKTKKDPLRKRKASETEMRQMRDFIYDKFGPKAISEAGQIGNGWPFSQMAVRILAWSVGEITDYELFATLQGIGDKLDIEIEMPHIDY